MDDENAIIPLCLYSTPQNSYIGLPEKIYQNDKVIYSCPNHPDFVTMFYAINPDVKPIPTYTDYICVKNINLETIDISSIYDPFNLDINCTRFLAWLEKTPYTQPLYIFKNGSNLLISLTEQAPENYIPHQIPVIHVLTADSAFKMGKNNIPLFTFSNSFGKCVPDPHSNLTLGQCIVLHNKNITNPEHLNKFPNILTYLKLRYGNKNKTNYIVIVFAILLIILLLVLIWIKMKKL